MAIKLVKFTNDKGNVEYVNPKYVATVSEMVSHNHHDPAMRGKVMGTVITVEGNGGYRTREIRVSLPTDQVAAMLMA